MKRIIWISVGAALVVACARAAEPVAENPMGGAAAVALTYAGVDLGTLPGGTSSGAQDINDFGVVVGQADNGAGQIRGFRWTASEGMKDLGTLPGGRRSAASRILNSGKILGTSETADGQWVEVVWNAQGRIERPNIPRLPPAPGFDGYWWSVSDFNDRGEFVGGTGDGDDWHGWFWSRAIGLVDLKTYGPGCMEMTATGINASGTVVGSFCNLYLHPFTWHMPDEFHDLGVGRNELGMNIGIGMAINDFGSVAGEIDINGAGQPYGFLWTRQKGYILLPTLAATYPYSYAADLNEAGVVVGSSYEESVDAMQPVAWPTPATLVRLNGAEPGSGGAAGINERGWIVGWNRSGSGPSHARLWRPTSGEAAIAPSPGPAAQIPEVTSTPGVTRSQLASCVTNRNVLKSRAALTECLMRH